MEINDIEENASKTAKIIFHGGCHGCLAQVEYGLHHCRGCQYYDPDWRLPNRSRYYHKNGTADRVVTILKNAIAEITGIVE